MKNSSPDFFRVSVRPWGLLMAAGVVACSASLFGFLGRFSWFLDLFSHFRVQYLLGLGVLGVIFFAGHRRKTAAIFLGFACVNLVFVAPLYFGGPKIPSGGSPVLRAMLLNVNTQGGDAARVEKEIHKHDPDILILEEISSRWISDLASLTNSYPNAITQPREDNFGIGLFSKLPIAESEIAYIGSANVPSILATLITQQTNLRVLATHPLPPGGSDYSRWRNEQLEQFPDFVHSPLPILLIGDLNVTPWSYHFRKLLARSGLRNSAQGYGIQPTWPNHNPLLRIPIDHCLHSPDISVVGRKIGADVSSDHYPLIIDFAIESQ